MQSQYGVQQQQHLNQQQQHLNQHQYATTSESSISGGIGILPPVHNTVQSTTAGINANSGAGSMVNHQNGGAEVVAPLSQAPLPPLPPPPVAPLKSEQKEEPLEEKNLDEIKGHENVANDDTVGVGVEVEDGNVVGGELEDENGEGIKSE